MENKQIRCLVTSHKPSINSFAMPAREIHHGHRQHSRGAWFGTVLLGAASKASESWLLRVRTRVTVKGLWERWGGTEIGQQGGRKKPNSEWDLLPQEPPKD